MTRIRIALATGLVLASPLTMAAVSDADFQALKDSVTALNQKLADVEKQLAEEKAKNQQAMTATAAPAPAAAAQPAPASWTDKVSVKGDLRVRYENIDQQGKDNRNRDRVRARAAIVGKPQDNLELVFGLSTRQDGDPVSGNQTLGNGGSGKDIYLDLAYFDWRALEGLNLLGGKMKNILYRPGNQGLIWDGDFNPEGMAATYVRGPFFVNGLGTWIESDSNKTQAIGVGGQLGVAWPFNDDVKLTAGAGYYYLNTEGKGPFWSGSTSFFGNSNANNQYLYDYKELEGFANEGFSLLGLPMSVFVDYVQNLDPDKYDTGWSAGLQLGAAKAKGTWELVYTYEDLERDAVFGLWTDSDFGGGGTDVSGHVFRGAYALTDKTNMAFSYFINQFGKDQGNELDYNRVQLDLNFKY